MRFALVELVYQNTEFSSDIRHKLLACASIASLSLDFTFKLRQSNFILKSSDIRTGSGDLPDRLAVQFFAVDYVAREF